MTTITREQLRERAREKVKSLEFAVTQTAFAENRAELEEELELARIALASLEAEPVAYLNATDIKNSEDHILAKRLRSHACTMPVYTATPAPVVPDANGCLPCPFCNSPVKWCGENSADPDDDHICHHIQCTNPECGADFDFINTGDDLLPDDPAVLDAMTSAELVQPLREVCKGRFNLRAAMLQGSQPVNNRDELPLDYLQGHKDGLEWAAQLAEANHPQTGDWLYDDPIELAKAIRKGPDMPESRTEIAEQDDNFYSWFGRFWIENYQQNNYTTSAKQMLGTMAEFAFRAGRGSETQVGKSPVIPDGWVACSERMPGSQEWVIVFAKWANQQVLCWDDVANRWTDFEDHSYFPDMFSHWMPLPSAPDYP